ncbi:MAG: Lar family restriction alleviation protein [Thermoguttaceae bacterium]|nr:Lar family restriction alleviation protein [Thermoguttaceae bacterium]
MSKEITDELEDELLPDDTREICETEPTMRPCPFCGNPPLLMRNPRTNRYHVACVNEDCIMSSDYRSPTKEEAVAMWNSRYNEKPIWTQGDIVSFQDRLNRICETELRLAKLCRAKENERDIIVGNINYQLFCPKCGKRDDICIFGMNSYSEWQIRCDCGYHTQVGTVDVVLQEFLKAWDEKEEK